MKTREQAINALAEAAMTLRRADDAMRRALESPASGELGDARRAQQQAEDAVLSAARELSRLAR